MLGKRGLTGCVTKVNLPHCEHYLAGKATRKSFGKVKHVFSPLDLFRLDICGPISVKDRTCDPYFITFVDGFTCYDHVYLISHNSYAL